MNIQHSIFNNKPRGGQTMLLMVIILTGSLLSIAMITGLIMLFQVRQAGDFTNSAKAIYAAEAGAEWWRTYKLKPSPSLPASSTINTRLRGNSKSSFEIFAVPGNPNQAKIVGTAGNSKRAILVTVQNLCAPDVMLAMDRSLSIIGFMNYKTLIKDSIVTISEQTIATANFGFIRFARTSALVRTFTNSTSTLSNDINLTTQSLENMTNITDPIITATGEFSPSNIPLKDRPDNRNKDYMLLVVDDLPNSPDPPVGSIQDIAATEAATAKGAPNNIKIVVVAINPSPNQLITNFYRDRIASQDASGNYLYFEATDYDNNLEAKLNEAAAAISSCL